MTRSKSAGVSLIESVVSMTILAIVAGVTITHFQFNRKVQAKFGNRLTATAELGSLAARMLRTGRLSRACFVAPNVLTCVADMHVPPTLDTTDDQQMRYIFTPTDNLVEYQVFKPGGWDTIAKYNGIVSFTVCDDNLMFLGCTVSNPMISGKHMDDKLAGGSPNNRFFRFQVQAKAIPDGVLTLQSAFFLRNPTIDPSVFYQVGYQD